MNNFIECQCTVADKCPQGKTCVTERCRIPIRSFLGRITLQIDGELFDYQRVLPTCLCGADFSLQACSGGASQEGFLGRVTLQIDDEFVDYACIENSRRKIVKGDIK